MTGVAARSTSGAKVPLRRRLDVEVRPSYASDKQAWLIKDPISLHYYELPEEEYFVWERLDGRTSWNRLREEYDRAFAPKQLDDRRLLQLLDEFHRRTLIVSDRPGQGTELHRRGKELRRADFWKYFRNPMAIRLPGFDPHQLLTRLSPWTTPIFTRSFVVAYLVLCVSAVLTAIASIEPLRLELSAAAGSFPSFDDWPSWFVAIAGAKIVHELAHAVACRRFGGECREMGVLFLCGVPCLYCDVSSIWMTPERWKRIAVGAAGIIAEVLLAAIALLLWRFSEPGKLHEFCLYLAVVCSLGTIVVNANPLLRYDGYFILADFLGITNLGEQADAAWSATTSRWFFGESIVQDRRLPRRHLKSLAAYAFLSTVYRILLMVGVLWLVRCWAEPRGLSLLADLFTAATIAALVIEPIRRISTTARLVRGGYFGNKRRFAVRSLALICITAALFLWPWPYHVDATAVVQLRDADYHFVVTGGELIESVPLGTTVEPGRVIAQLHDPQLAVDVLRQEADVARRRLYVANLERRRVADPSQQDALPAARELLKSAESQLEHLRDRRQRLKFVAARRGTVLPLLAFRRPGEESNAERSPLEPDRHGAYLMPGTPLCAVGDVRTLEAELAVDQHEIEFLVPGQTVRLRLDSLGGRILVGRVIELAEAEHGDLGVGEVEDAKTAAAHKTQYLVRVALDEEVLDVPIGAVGRAKIEVAPRSLWTRLCRTIAATFRFDRGS